MGLAKRILALSEEVNIKDFNKILNNFTKPMIHLKKFAKFELGDAKPEDAKKLKSLVAEITAKLDELDKLSEKILFDE